MTREVIAGSSYQSSEDPRLHFGLAGAERVSVTVERPDGSIVDLDDVAADQIVRIESPSG